MQMVQKAEISWTFWASYVHLHVLSKIHLSWKSRVLSNISEQGSHNIYCCRNGFVLVLRLFADLTAMSKGLWILQAFGKCIKKNYNKTQMERILDCTSCAWNSFTSRTAFSIKHFPKVFFSWDCSHSRVHGDGRLQLVVWEGLENVNKRQFGSDLWPWALGTTHMDEEQFAWDECLTCHIRVLTSPWIRAKSTRRADLPTCNHALCPQFVCSIAVGILFYVCIVILSLFPPECLSVAISSFLYKSQPTGVGSNTHS